MEHDREARPGRVRLPRFDEALAVQQAAVVRDGGMRRLRHVSNWTAAALIAGVAATSGYFAHANAATYAAATSGVAATAPASVGTAATAGATHRPSISTPVATSSGSGVTVGASGSGVTPGTAGVGGVGGTGGAGGTGGTWLDN